MSTKLNATPTTIVAKKETTCPVCVKPVRPGQTAANPGMGSDFWCHALCVGRLYINVRPIENTKKVLVDDFVLPLPEVTHVVAHAPDSSARPVFTDPDGFRLEMPNDINRRWQFIRTLMDRYCPGNRKHAIHQLFGR